MRNYFASRLQALGISADQAKAYGLTTDKDGNILQHIRYFSGEQVTFIPKPKRAKYANVLNRRTIGMDNHLKSYEQPLFLQRYHPDNIPPGAGKYKFPSKHYTGLEVLPMPTNGAIKAYNDQKKGGMCVGVEGYFKAVALDVNGVESVAFSGISTYKLCEQIKDYLLIREPETFVILYDGDALNVSTKTETITDQRVKGFYSSANKFAGAFFDFCQTTGLKTKLYFAMVHPEHPVKGVDDLLQAASDKSNVISAFNSLQSNKYFLFEKLSKTTYKKALNTFFALTNHREFYHRHRAIIGQQSFIFSGATFQRKQAKRHYNLFKYQNDYHTFNLLDRPFAIDIPTIELSITEYVSEAEKQITKLLKKHSRIAFNAPTGSGKTSFFVRWAISTKTPIVVVVPTVSQCKQLAAKKEYTRHIATLYGHCNIRKRAKAMQSRIIVCTYDALQHVTDLFCRVLIVDESHNLVNAYGYRAKALRSVYKAFDRAKQVVMLSGTQSKALAKYAGFEFVNITRKQSPEYNVFEVEASEASKTVTFLSFLDQIDFSRDKIHFVYLNNIKQINSIREYIQSKQILEPGQMATISRPDIESGTVQIYDEIIRNEEITSPVRLVFCTCLIAEGININNTNIGNIYCIGIKCVDSFRQFVARFRKMMEVNVYSIRDKEKRPKTGFKISPESNIKLLTDQAKAQIEFVTKNKRLCISDYPENDLPYIEQILPDYQISGRTLKFVYDDAGTYKTDLLSILFEERERKIKFTFNASFYSELSEHGFNVEGIAAVEVMEEIKQAYKEQLKADKDAQQASRDEIRQDLTIRPNVVLVAAKMHAEQHRSDTTIFQNIDESLLNVSEVEAQKYLYDQRSGFEFGWFGYIIRGYCKLSGLNIAPGEISAILNHASKSSLKKFFKALLVCAEFSAYDNKRQRLQLSIQHRAEIKAKKKIKELIKAKADQAGKITSKELRQVLRAVWTKRIFSPDLSGVNEVTAVTYTDNAAKGLIESFFKVQTVVLSNHRDYNLTDEYYTGTADFLHRLCVLFFNVETSEKGCNALSILDLCKNN